MCLHEYVCIPHMYRALGGQDRVLDALDLELQMAVTCHVGAGDQTRSSVRTASAVNHGTRFPDLKNGIFKKNNHQV